MANVATMENTPENLSFAKSESKAVGMHGSLMDKMRDNAPRIVGLMKIGMDVAVAMTGSPWLIAYAAFAITGRMISIIYGSKHHQEKLVEEKAAGRHQKLLGHSLRENDRKIFSPRKYPVEASAGLSVIAESFGVGYGIARFMAGATGFTPLLTGLIAVWSYGNIVFHKEKKQENAISAQQENPADNSLVFSQSKSKATGIVGRTRQSMKNNPVLVSSMVNVSICAAMFLGGLIEGLPLAYLVASIVGGLANLTQGLLVRKNDYNIEGAAVVKEGETKEPSPATFQERIVKSRDNDLGLQPA